MAIFRSVDALGIDYVRKFSEAYKKGSKENKYVRESLCEDIQFPKVFIPPRASDLLCGKRLYPEVGYSPQVGGMGYYFDSNVMNEHYLSDKYSDEELSEWKELIDFWAKESTVQKCNESFSPTIKERLAGVYDGGNSLFHPAYALFRMSGLQLDLKKLINKGIQGLENDIRNHVEKAADKEAKLFYSSALLSAQRIYTCIEHYIQESKKLPASDKSRRMEDALSGLLNHAPHTFHEGLQLVLLVQSMTGTINFGRLDTALGQLLVDDLNEERLTWEESLELMQNFYTIIDEEIWHFDGRITIGGMGRSNEAAADKFALLCMETTDIMSLPMPQLTLRFYEGQNTELINKAYQVISNGKTFPMLYNDDINIPAVQKSFNIDRKTAEQYIPFGCGEYMIEKRSCGTPNFIINLQMCLELAMNNGKLIRNGKQLSPNYGSIKDYYEFKQLWEAYDKTVTNFIEAGVEAQYQTYKTTGNNCPFSLISVLYEDCLNRGKSIFDGGIEFLGGTNETYGNNNTSDSLIAINELIYKSHRHSREDLLSALKANWKGFESMQEAFKNAPKFGNDNDIADEMQTKVHNHICKKTAQSILKTKLHHFLVVVINNNHNTLWGKHTSASPDGRNHGEPLAPGNAPGAGRDRNGLTALLNSQAKADPSIHAGAVQNIRISSELPKKNKKLYEALFNTYFKIGGTQAMITVTNRNDLTAALKTPEKYANLLVRVGGFSARFIDLDKTTQQEILSRTEHE